MVTLAAGDVAAHGLQISPGQVTVVGFDRTVHSTITVNVEILTDGSTDVWYTLDGSTPAVGGAHSYRIPAGAAGIEQRALTPGLREIKLTATATTTVSIQRST